MPWQPAAIQSNRGTKLIEILRLSHKGNREIKSNVYPLARITNKLSVRWTFHPRPASAKSTFDSRLLSTPFFLANNPKTRKWLENVMLASKMIEVIIRRMK